MLINRAALVVKNLLQPKTRHRRIQQPEQPQVLVFAAASGQLDDRRGTIENLAATVEDEVVVGGDEGEAYAQRNEKAFPLKSTPFKPRESDFLMGSSGLTSNG